MPGQLLLSDTHIVASFDFDPDIVAAVKQVPGRWDATAKVWRIPVEKHEAAVRLAIDNNWWIDPAIAAINMPGLPTKDELTYDGSTVSLHFPYDQVKVRAVKQIPGVTWSKASKGWTAPATSLREAIMWAEKFGIHVDDGAYRARDEIVERHDALIQQSRDTDAELDVAGLPLLPYQRAGVRYAAAARRTFIADDMGLGKTLQAIATLEYVNQTDVQYPAVIVCPPTLVLNWKKEYEKWLPHRKVVTIVNRKDFPSEPHDVLVVGYSNIKAWENQLQGFRAYVFDESHYLKSPDAQRTKAAIKIVKKVPQGGVVLCLTGTPVTNRPAEYAPQLELLGKLKDFGGKWGFYRRYCNAFRDRFGQWNIDGHSNLDELNDRLRGNCFTGDALVLTDIGCTSIHEIVSKRYDGYALGWSSNLGWRWGRIVGWSEHRASKLVTVHLDGGRRFTCTPEHLIHVEGRGWVEAGALKPEDVLCEVSRTGVHNRNGDVPRLLASGSQSKENKGLQNLRERVCCPQSTTAILRENLCSQGSATAEDLSMVQEGVSNHAERSSLLLSEVLQFGGVSPWGSGSLHFCSGSLQHEPKKNCLTASSQEKNGKNFPSGYAVEEDSWLVDGANGMANILWGEVLVCGYGGSDQSSGYRSGWLQSSAARPAIDGRAQGVPTQPCRVERVEVHQCGSGSQSRVSGIRNQEMVSVYDIEVDGVHSFVANGVLAHNCYIRRTKDQVLSELPSVRHAKVLVDGTAAGMKEYRKAEEDIVKYLADRAAQIARELGQSPGSAAVRAKMRAERNEHLVKIGTLRKLAARAKMGAVTEWVDNVIESGSKVVIAAHHREIVDELASKYGNLKIQGGMDVRDVEEHKRKFQEMPVADAPTIVLSIQAAKTGHTLTAAQDVLFVELPWSPADVDQTYSRCHRLGQKGSVTSTYLLCAGTIDEHIYNVIERKRGVVDAAVDGSVVDGAGSDVFDHYLKLMG